MARARWMVVGWLLLATDAAATTIKHCDVLVLGGSASGVAASVAASTLGKSVCLVESTPWLGGQLLLVTEIDENVHPDCDGLHPELCWPASAPFSASYRNLRLGVQTDAAGAYQYNDHCGPFDKDTFDPGLAFAGGSGARLGFQPRFMARRIQDLVAGLIPAGNLFLDTDITSKLVSHHTTIRGVLAHNRDTGQDYQLNADITIDATEFGDFIGPRWPPAIDNRVGVEAYSDTGDADAPATANSTCVSAATFPFYLQWVNNDVSPISKPLEYETLKPLYANGNTNYAMDEDCDPGLPYARSAPTLWNWRRSAWPPQFSLPPLEQTSINYPADPAPGGKGGNDFNRNCLGGTPAGCELINAPDRGAVASQGQALSRGLAYYLQTVWAPPTPSIAAPVPPDPPAHPTLTRWAMNADETEATFPGSPLKGGFAPLPYVRESRRIRAVTTVLQQDIAKAFHPTEARPKLFPDTVGVGHYALDILHQCAGGDPVVACWNTPGCSKGDPATWPPMTLPYQIPLGALIPRRPSFGPTEGFLAAGKNIGLTHITAGAYRTQPIEWHTGLAAGAAAAVSLDLGLPPRYLVSWQETDPALPNYEPQFGSASRPHVQALRRLQQSLVQRLRSPIYWWADVWDAYPDAPDPAGAALFEATQMVAADQIMLRLPDHGIAFKPDTHITRQIGAVAIMRAIHKWPLATACAADAFVDVPCDDHPAYDHVQALKDHGSLVTTIPESCEAGRIDGTHFQPLCDLKRRDFVRFLLLANGYATYNPPSPHFTDVAANDPDYVYIEGALRAYLLDVPVNGPFHPDEPLTRSQAALMLYNSIKWYYALWQF